MFGKLVLVLPGRKRDRKEGLKERSERRRKAEGKVGVREEDGRKTGRERGMRKDPRQVEGREEERCWWKPYSQICTGRKKS